MEHGVSVGCLLQSYFNVGWESKLHRVHPACAKVNVKLLGGDSRALAGTGARLVSAVRGCFFSWGQCSPSSAVGPALLTPGRSLFRVVRTCGLGGK